MHLECGFNTRKQNDTVWTKVTENDTAILSIRNVLRFPSPTVNTKVLCHNELQSEVYSIHYLPSITPGRL